MGKEIVARIIHYGPNQAALPFVDINCTALSPGLFESELFGYEAGAYTGGAGRGGRGKLDIAQGGTLFLDELAEIPVELQAKLLRVIEERSFYRVGGLAKIATDIRIVAAANIDFEEHISRGLFRKDLYYRLRVGSIVVPPLRKRPDDIVPLARMFLRSFAKKRGKALAEISPEAAAVLLAHAWPGNVRELRNAMEWVSVMHDGAELVPGHLAGFLSGPAARTVVAPARSRTSRPGLADIDAAIAASGGNKTEAAARLGMSIRMLHYRLKNRSAS
ncbi:sigma-54 dependent transcriptional regulator/response regulator [Desulfovibrio sp. DV]|nr:sigma-54 dependent transcriptional regulator/response regulator [Desulfovibrio sp. DV]